MPETQTNIFLACRSTLKKGMSLLEHRHPYWQFGYLLRGRMTVLVDKKEYTLEAGDCVLYPSMAFHAILPVDVDIEEYELKFQVFDEKLEKNLALVPVVFHGSSRTETILSCIFDFSHSNSAEDVRNAENFLYALLSGFIRDKLQSWEEDSAYILTEGYKPVTKKILVYIEKNYTSPFSLPELGKALNYNENYLSSSFKQNTGVSIVDYLNLTRIRHAVIWFSYNALDVTTVYEAAGFSSINHFSRTFRKFLGVSPREYRKAFPRLFSRGDEGSSFSSEPFFMNSRMTMADAFKSLQDLGCLTRDRLSRDKLEMPEILQHMNL